MITVEERVMIALIDYINAKPEHQCGLCYYLDEVVDTGIYYPKYYDLGDDSPSCKSYSLIPLAREKMPEFGPKNSYITCKSGPTPRRLEFAATLLKSIETGDVYYCTESHMWKLS